RLLATRHPENSQLAGLVGEMAVRSQEFRELWAHHDVKEKTFGVKALNHPLVGGLVMAYESFPLPGEQDMVLVTYVPEPGSAAAEKLALLASWSVPELEQDLADGGVALGSADRAEE
ncbi:hypothetical protein ACFQ1S_15360, partial [Kibdelosporangium lantanae]